MIVVIGECIALLHSQFQTQPKRHRVLFVRMGPPIHYLFGALDFVFCWAHVGWRYGNGKVAAEVSWTTSRSERGAPGSPDPPRTRNDKRQIDRIGLRRDLSSIIGHFQELADFAETLGLEAKVNKRQ